MAAERNTSQTRPRDLHLHATKPGAEATRHTLAKSTGKSHPNYPGPKLSSALFSDPHPLTLHLFLQMKCHATSLRGRAVEGVRGIFDGAVLGFER